MSVAYVTPGSAIRSEQLNALTAELDAALRVLFGEKSWLCYIGMPGLVPEGTRFYFGTSASWKIIPRFAPSATAYSHASFTSAASALAVTSYDASTNVAVANQPDPWPLEGSLEAHKTTVGGIPYFYRQDRSGTGDYGTRECYRRLKVAEIVIEANGSSTFDWSPDWNKYHFLRFHNLDNQTLTVNLGGSNSFTIGPFGVRSVRRAYPAADSWDWTYYYLFSATHGDSLCWDCEPANNVGSLVSFHRWLDALRRAMPAGTSNGREFAVTTRGLHINPGEVWDGSALLPQAIAGSTELGKFEHHLGELIVYQNASATPPSRGSITPTWTTLSSGTGGVKLTASTGSVPHVLTVEADTGAVAPVDVFGLGSTITPRLPKTLPFNITFGAVGIGQVVATDDTRIPGVDQASFSTTQTWYSAFGTVAHNVTQSINFQQWGEQAGGGDAAFTSPATASHWSDLSDHAALSSSSSSEQATTPTIQWKSDGWRLVAYSEANYPLSLEAWPTDGNGFVETQLCDVSDVDGFTLRCGGDVLARDSWDVTYKTHGRKTSDYVGYESAGIPVYTTHPDIAGLDPIADGIEWQEARTTPSDPGTFRTESIGITAANTGTLPVYPSVDSGETIGKNNADLAWYALNRTDLIAGNIPNSDLETLVRLPILAIHYNHVAQRLNGIFAIDPFLFDDVYYYGELADGSWPHAVFAPYYYAPVLSAGSVADSLGIPVNSLTIGGTTGYYVRIDDCATWAASAGFRFCVERFAGVYQHISGSSSLLGNYYTKNDSSFPYRRGPSLLALVYVTVDVDDGTAVGPVSTGPGLRYGDTPTEGGMVEVERCVENGATPPTGWTLDGSSYVYAFAHSTIHYDNTTLVAADLASSWEPFSLYSAPSVSPSLFPITDFPLFTRAGDVSNLFSVVAGSRDCYKLVIIPRFLFTRTP